MALQDFDFGTSAVSKALPYDRNRQRPEAPSGENCRSSTWLLWPLMVSTSRPPGRAMILSPSGEIINREPCAVGRQRCETGSASEG
jgi:hypothetical protein